MRELREKYKFALMLKGFFANFCDYGDDFFGQSQKIDRKNSHKFPISYSIIAKRNQHAFGLPGSPLDNSRTLLAFFPSQSLKLSDQRGMMFHSRNSQFHNRGRMLHQLRIRLSQFQCCLGPGSSWCMSRFHH